MATDDVSDKDAVSTPIPSSMDSFQGEEPLNDCKWVCEKCQEI